MRLLLFSFVVLLTGCQPDANSIGPSGLVFDQYKNSDAIRGGDSYADGGSGVLLYENSCLYLDDNGGRTGLVMPPKAGFDGKILTYRGEKYKIGNRYAIGGVLVKRSEAPPFYCETPYLLLANSQLPQRRTNVAPDRR